MKQTTFWWIFFAALIVYIPGLSVDLMDVDSSQYASISREMAESGSFLQVMNNGQDYLDKPPLIFWMGSLFFYIFGYADWAFKLGSFLFSLLGVYSTFKLGSLLYNARVGRLAAIILFSCQAFFLFNNDVRTDTILTGSVIFAIWQLAAWLETRRLLQLVGAAIGIACAMLAKGPVGLMVPVFALGCYLVGKGRWSDIFNRWYLLLILLVALFLTPMLWGLYTQFDLQPEKSVPMITPEGYKYETGVSGLKFYLWTQSFGRITGESSWSNNSGPFFFVHNFLWSFLPWALMFIMAFFSRIAKVIKSYMRGDKLPELLTLGGFILPFIALSLSGFKLPHYIFVLYPLAAILLASWWEEGVWKESIKGFKLGSLISQLLIWAVSSTVLYFIFFDFFQGSPAFLWLISAGLLLISLLFMVRGMNHSSRLILGSVILSLAVNFTMNSWFYPNVLKYQSGTAMARFIDEEGLDQADVYEYNYSSYSFNFYGERIVQMVNDGIILDKLNSGEEIYVVTRDPYYTDLQRDFKVHTLYTFGSHSVTLLNLKFLRPDTRAETLKQVYLIKILGRAETESEL